MAVKATFAADFTSFTKAVRDAEVQLGDLETGASSVQKSLTRIGTSFAGSKLIQDATLTVKAVEELGGATKLTGDEQVRVNALLTEAINKYRALGQTAPKEMVALAEATKATETSASKLSAIDFSQTFTNPIGTAKDAMGALGIEMGTVLGGAAGLATAVGGAVLAFVALGKAAADADAKLDDLHDMTGLSVPALSRLSNAANVIGADMGTLSKGLFEFEKRLAGASPEFVKGLEAMGLSLEQVRALKPDEYYPVIAEGLAKITDQSIKAEAGAALFGKSARELIPVVADLARGFELSAGITPVTAEQARNAEEFGFQLSALSVSAKAAGIEIGRTLVPALQLGLDIFNKIGVPMAKWTAEITGIPGMVRTAASAISYLSATWDTFSGRVLVNKDMIDAAEGGLAAHRASVAKLTPVVGDETAAFALQASVLTDLNDKNRAHAEELKKQKEAQDVYNKSLAAAAGYAQPLLAVLYSIDGAVVEGARVLLDHGAKVEDVGRMYALTEAQVHAIVQTMKDENEWLKVVGEQHKTTAAIAVNAEQKVREERDKTLAAVNKGVIDNLNTQREYNDKLVAMSASSGDKLAVEWTAALNRLGPPRQGFEEDWQRTVDSIDRYFAAKMSAGNMEAAAAAAGTGTGNAFKDSLLTTLDGVPALMQQALTGGGGFAGFGKALTAGLGADIGKAVGSSNMAGSLADGLAKITGASGAAASGGIMKLVTGGLTGGISALADVGVQLVGKLITKVFNNPEKQINPIRQGFIDAAGGLDALNQKAYAATGSLTLVQNVLGAKNADQYKAAIDSLTAALNAHQTAVAATVTTYGTIGEKLNSVTTISGPLKAALDAAMSTTTAEGFKTALENVGKEIDAQAAKQGVLNGLVSKYGLDWTDAGEAFRQAKINEVAGGLITDFTNLSGVFSNLNPVMEGMKKPLADFISEAQKAGVVVPAGMKQVIQTAIDAGTVFDDAGVKVTDLNELGIKFGDESSQGADDVNVAMAGLADTMNKILQPEIKTATDDASALAKALKDLPPDIVTRVHFVSDPFPAPPGSTTAPAGTPGFATGTGGRFVDFGSGTLAMLHGREAIVPEGQSAGSSDEHLIGLRQDMTELRRVLVAEQRLAPERLTLALRGLLAVTR